ncbi:peptidase M16 domain protein [Afipia carboxidovorans OM5]|uniref:Putative Zn-dependent peptidase n=1 Tax=Afipia carboxidovorans (strain ATCC 49405 / DSM 1227 / KCTC 32145 / OM5) TaxID=504832 RepID=B6JIU9_AFIC5|nr:pitrilysin family protein [Afipia carboxidovorans]ACI94343.1 peptidase M16 domain protein [Afipia carboxidovorans OM5]AEI02021.1 putative Zn-dependent peptidase [Afipia carboxidovorans OM4]AEI05597.1 putative Zn-dependent peptidase [Afipia carboxidovorans OM5]
MTIFSPFMRTLALGALLAFGLAPSAEAAAKIQRVISPGGIEAWLVQDATVPLVAMQFAFRGGSAQDPADKPGVAQLMSDNLDEGAGDLDSKAYHERLDRNAIQISFSVTRDYIRGSLRMLKESRDEAFDLVRLAVTSPRFDAEPLERVRAQTISILRRESVTPGPIASNRFFAEGFPNHPYAHSPRGTLESIPTISADDLRAYRQKTFARDGLTVGVVGDIDADTLGKLLDKTFGALPAKGDLALVPQVTLATSAGKVAVPLDVPQTSILFGTPALKRDDPDFMAAYIVNHIMGGGSLSSRLYHEVREKRGLAYSVSESLWWMDKTSLMFGNTATRADKANETVERIAAELKRMADEGPTQQELDEAKSYLKGSQMLALDSSTKFAGALVQYQLDKLGIDYLDRRPAIIDAVTLDDAKRVAKKIWGQPLLTVSVGRPPAEATAPKPMKN